MGTPLRYKVYVDGKYIAAARYAEDAANIASCYADGIIKYVSWIVWKEGKEAFSCGESYDGAARIMHGRIRDKNIKMLRKQGRSDEEIISIMGGPV